MKSSVQREDELLLIIFYSKINKHQQDPSLTQKYKNFYCEIFFIETLTI